MTTAELDEATLVARARDRDVDAFAALLRRYQRRIFALCLRMLDGASAEAEDVTQEVFVTAWRRLPELQHEAAFGGWLYRAATNRCLNLLRTRRPTHAPATDGGVGGCARSSAAGCAGGGSGCGARPLPRRLIRLTETGPRVNRARPFGCGS